MTNKVLSILTSVRFWVITLTAVIAVLDGNAVLTVIQVWLASVAAIGTLDSVALKIGGGK